MASSLRFLSPTKLRTYATCPLQYRHRYIDQWRSPYTPASLRGDAVHQTLEANFVRKKRDRRDLEPAEALEIFDDAWRRQAPAEAEAETEADAAGAFAVDEWDAAYAEGTRLLEHYLATEAPRIVPHLVEHRFRFSLPGVAVPVVGTVDLIDQNGVVIDHKTAREPFDPNYPATDMQLVCYAIAYATFRAGSRLRPGMLPSPYFIPEVRVDVLVATDPPSVQRLTAKYRAEDLEAFAERAGVIAAGIEAERFDAFWKAPGQPRDPAVCGRCGYATRCDDSLARPVDLLEPNGDDGDDEE